MINMWQNETLEVKKDFVFGPSNSLPEVLPIHTNVHGDDILHCMEHIDNINLCEQT